MNICVKGLCSSGAIGRLLDSRHIVHMSKNYRRTFLREWRKHRARTLVQVAEHLNMTHGQLSKIERGDQPYNQALLEALADLYMCDVVDLLIRAPADPKDPTGTMWSIWEQAKPGDKQKIVAVARTITGLEEEAA